MRLKKGFTLVELLVALAIITILSAVVLPALHRARDEARKAEAISELRALDSGIRMFEMDYGAYPPSGNANLIASLQAGSYVNKIDEGDLKKGVMFDPWKHSYVYLNPGIINPKSYDLYSLRKNGLMILASVGGVHVGPLAKVLEDIGSNLDPKALDLPLPIDPADTTPNDWVMYLPLAMDFLRENGYAYVADAIGRNGYNIPVSITLSATARDTSGVWNGNTISITIYDSGDANINTGKIAAVLVHEGLHAMYDYMNTAYDYEYTIDEEYVNDVALINIWKTSKSKYGGSDWLLDLYESWIDTGEDYLKEVLRQIYGLGEYPGWEQQSRN
ncbi:MAG: prepilin-type N-terminal cleavage/methylation domain-containing protein [Nitrospirae bacterium]|nr:prepilin-type N-terminal cleavage/methylation domain-containing protein [Nitrospirota bacterium]